MSVATWDGGDPERVALKVTAGHAGAAATWRAHQA